MRKLFIMMSMTLGLAFNAFADGVTEFTINPATGITISTSGNYRLAADVSMNAVASPAINVTVSNVTIDLAGHNIKGPTASGPGLNSTGSRVLIFNGRITDFGNWGILGATGTTVRDVVLSACNRLGFSGGISVGAGSVVESCSVIGELPEDGSIEGIHAGNNSRIAGNLVDNNISPNDDVTGILALSGCEIIDNIVSNNSTSGGNIVGILTDTRCLIRGNNVAMNLQKASGDATGIQGGAGSRVDRNSVVGNPAATGPSGNVTGIRAVQSSITNNDCVGHGPTEGNGLGRGIIAETGCLVSGNRCDSNISAGTGTAAGIEANSSCWILHNECRSNTGFRAWGIRITGGGNLVSSNATQNHSTGGILFVSAASNRAEMNRLRDPTGIDLINGVAPTSLGAGELGNIVH